ncbi:hypothetical protein KF707_02000 [Candidatus Obscuribacterales bacterium]|nr:hypothetical protein [Candidatus Obscuribacterales bacterium]MBX3150726.1 hypothetical protein [Candidatus Obscuribacterales bacterium]
MVTKSFTRALSLTAATCVLLSATPTCPAYGQSETDNAAQNDPVLRGYTSDSNLFEQIDSDILKKEVELLKLNAEFRTHYTAGDRWKKRRMKLYDFAGGGIANAGDIALLSQFWRYYRNPGDGLAHKGRLESGPLVVMIAYCTLGGLYALEGCYDLAKDYKGKQKGFAAKTVYKKALAAKIELDKLFAVRDQKLQALNSDNCALQTAQGRVLKDVRDLSLIEFSRVYVDSRKQKAARDLTTLGTIAVCATGAWPGAYAVLRGVKDVNLKKVGSGGIGFLISGSTLTAAPVLIHGGAAITGKVCTSKLEESLVKSQSTTIAALEKDLTSYREIASKVRPSVDHSQHFAVVQNCSRTDMSFLKKSDAGRSAKC